MERKAQAAIRIAAASSDGVTIDRHFGHADVFSIWETVADGASFTEIERRQVSPPCQHGHHEADAMQAVVAALGDCRYVLAEAIGRVAAAHLAASGITPLETEDTMTIAEAAENVLAYERRQRRLRSTPFRGQNQTS